MVEVTQEELWGLNGLNAMAQNTQAEFQRQMKAVEAYINLLEVKYSATYDRVTGKLEENKKDNAKYNR